MVFDFKNRQQLRLIAAIVVLIASIHLSPLTGLVETILEFKFLGLKMMTVLMLGLFLTAIGLFKQEI